MKPVVQQSKASDQTQLEILKAVAQAWHGHTHKSSTDAKRVESCRRDFSGRPSRFKTESLRDVLQKSRRGDAGGCWDFGQSLWDSYEIVKVSKRLEDGMVLEHSFAKPYSRNPSVTRSREAVNSLRFLFNHMSSRRFAEPLMP
uniref:Uncharacterized protein n=1 Tax=Kalanchoe fedtschenkoi TaxID=63787 RepID=A0A7N0RAF7_KALFE